MESADAVLSGSATDDYVGSAVIAVPDLYGDGSSALVIGASGISTVYLIDDYPFASTRVDSAADTLLLGAETPESGGAGTSLASAGDLNDNGYTDLLIGAPGEAADAGRVYVVFGRSQVDFDAFGGTLDLATWADSEFTGENSGDAAGTALSGIGDQNLDGCDDFIIGAPGVDYEGMSDAGAVYLMLGHPTDMGMGINELAHLSGSWEGGELGSDIDGSDDLNGDGFRDLLIGAPSYNDAGAAFVLFGGSL